MTPNLNKFQILATPIGNLQEITLRALNSLKECQCILCEDTRVTGKLLANLKIDKKELISYQKFNEKDKLDLALNKIKTKKTILVSDAGYPCLSDPGYNLVNACYENNIIVEVINGPSCLMHSLVISGLNINNFYFNGFLPASACQRKTKLKDLLKIDVPIVVFESVHRIFQSLQDIDQIFNHPFLVVCRELTKLNESIYRGTYDQIKDKIVEKGEFVIIIQKQNSQNSSEKIEKDQIIDLVVKTMKENNIKLKPASKIVARQLNMQASLIYNIYVNANRIK